MQDSLKKAILFSLAIGVLFMFGTTSGGRSYFRGNAAELMMGAFAICAVIALIRRELGAAAIYIVAPFFFFAVRSVLTKWGILL